MRARLGPAARRGVPVALLLLTTAACGGTDDDAGAGSSVEPTGDDPAETAEAVEAGASDDATAEASGRATVTLDGTSRSFPDIVECEVDGETWGEGWRRLVAWSEDGHDLLDITVGNEESESLGAVSSVTVVIGTQNPHTLDQGNPDQEWSETFGDGAAVAATLQPDGASGATSVGQASGGDPVTAEWSFTC